MRVAAIDLGTNSFLCLIADVEHGQLKKIHRDISRTVRLGEKVHETKRLQPSALIRADQCLGEFSHAILEVGHVDKVLAVATSAARDVSNREELIKIGHAHGISIDVISGEKEMELTFNGMVFDREEKDGLMGIDIGGGSTEIVYKTNGKIAGKSVNVGGVRLTEMFVKNDPPDKEEVGRMIRYAEKELEIFKNQSPRELIAVAGTPTSLACLEQGQAFDSKSVHGFKMSVPTIDKWLDKLSRMTVKEKSVLPGLDALRADIIVAGTALLSVGAKMIGVSEVTVSVCGARYGLALELGK